MPVVPVRQGPAVEEKQAAQFKLNTQLDEGVMTAQNSLSKATSDFASTVSDIQAKAKNQADQMLVLEKRREFEKLKDQELYSPTGALYSKGKNAFESSERAKEKLSLAGQELTSSLQNENQKFLFDNYLGDQEVDIGHRLTVHTSKEINDYDNDLTKSSLEGLKNRAVTDFSDPNKLARNLADQEILIRQNGERNGLPPEAIDNMVLGQKSATHMSVLSKMSANEMDIGASKYFKAVKNSMTEADQIQATKMLQESSYRGQSQRFVDNLVRNGGTLETGLAEASKIQEPRLREDTENRLIRVMGLRKQAEDQRQESIQLNALNLIDQGKGIEAIPVEQWSSLDDNRRGGIMTYIGRKARGEDRKTDFETYYDLKELAAKNPETFAKVNLLEYQSKLGNSELKSMIDLQTGVKSGKKGMLDGFMTDQQVVKAAMEEAGIKNKKDQAEFMAVIDSETVKNRPKNNDELRQLVNKKLTKVITDKGFIYDSTKFEYQLDPAKDKIEGVKYNSIPREEKARITEFLKRKGMPVTEQSVEALYTQGIKTTRTGK